MTTGAYHGVALHVGPSEYHPDGVQRVRLDNQGRHILLPPIEYTVKPGDRIVVETAPDRCDEACEVWRITINGKPLLTRPLWDAYFEDHPRPWLGEYVENGKILTIRGEMRQ